ncbi:hypothetical protein DEU56DRAFT_816786 [Suillus clintonianus]|uniref:uncharacterized protein n=1 Tax=Suillus clintonianus TaxID=1904413 RepID=UPI001B86EA3E|nr:uncharacterized protein DEU56DRAFT_816786 [Suillus clintonianus]KAG2129802.1 hypothetical protein DEU56DRAFT_816786 [Suillus clintonianus]
MFRVANPAGLSPNSFARPVFLFVWQLLSVGDGIIRNKHTVGRTRIVRQLSCNIQRELRLTTTITNPQGLYWRET